jgi:hypothetical protein
MQGPVYNAVVRQQLLMCMACWNIHPGEDGLEFESDHWVDPTTFLAGGQRRSRYYRIVDGYCDSCLVQLMTQIQDARHQADDEHLNA